jgi:hypothetical protein
MKLQLLAFTFLLVTSFVSHVPGQSVGETKPLNSGSAISIPSVSPTPIALVDISEREKSLIERIKKLERRIDELESAERPRSDSVGNGANHDPSSSSGSLPTQERDIPTSPQLPAPLAKERGEPKKEEPFTFADFTWLTGNPRTTESPISNEYFTAEFRSDVNFTNSFSHPKDDTIGGSSEVFRSGEFQLTQLGVGGDLHYKKIRGRLMTQFGMYSQTTPRNDASPSRGQWNLDNAYRYVSEAYGGYHWNKWYGINVDAGIFMSYVGLYSYYQFDNWSYQPSYVSSNTPWFFNGVRVQIYPTKKLKIEPWIINGWQSYGKFNSAPGIGGQIKWAPTGSFVLVANNYFGTDTLGNKDRKRIHTDDSIQAKYFDDPKSFISKGAFTFTFDAGCEFGGGVSCGGSSTRKPAQYFIGFMAYNRLWFSNDKYALTLGGGAITNPGRYLVLIPPINGATAASGTSYFTANPGDKYRAWDASATFDYMPTQFSMFRFEYNHRAANVPYFSGPGGITPPGGNNGEPGSFVPGWQPDLLKFERRFTIALLVKL